MPYTIVPNHTPSEEESRLLLRGLSDHAKLARGQDLMSHFAFFIRDDETSKLMGGIQGVAFYGCLHTDLLWVDSSLRSEGWGTELMSEGEEFGRQHHCTFATVNTMDWEALPFYTKIGYEVEFVREGFRHGSKMYFLRKQLLPTKQKEPLRKSLQA
jgi:GNAT superfamily N-acetyltransferase